MAIDKVSAGGVKKDWGLFEVQVFERCKYF